MSTPTHLSATDVVDLHEAEVGAELLGLPLTEQGRIVAAVMQSTTDAGKPSYRQVGVQMPRRSTKTTTLTAVILGRMATRRDYRVISTAQTGDIARRIYRDVVLMLDTAHAGMDEDERPYHARVANGTEVLTWKSTGSTWRPVTPNPLAYRSAAADLLVFDEAGHISVETARELRAGAFPTTDTRPGAQILVTGTPNEKSRAGMLWDTLSAGREGKRGIGVVDYCLTDDETIANEDGTLNEELLRRVHPGIDSGLTDIDVMVERFESMMLEAFEAEYCGKWGLDAGAGAVNVALWATAGRPMARKPEKFAWSFAVAPDGSSAAVCAAWRDADGVAHLEVLKHAPGASWVAPFVRDGYAATKVAIGYESIGANLNVVEELERLRPKVRTCPLTYKDVVPAQQRFTFDLADGRVVHFDQPSLTKAAAGSRWKATDKGRSWNWSRSFDDIAPLVAAVNAVWIFDKDQGRPRLSLTAEQMVRL